MKVALPGKHSIRADQLLVISDFKLTAQHPLIEDLVALRKQVFETLQLEPGTKPVMVYLFSNELEYRQYFRVTYPGFPDRRAFFVQTPGNELAVYTFWGDRIQEDLRHEFTHGLLHSRLLTVPLWLDEGLAEYFEVTGPRPGGVNRRSQQDLVKALQGGWRPDMPRLEQMEKVEQMQRLDYQESWAWVHFLLNSSADSRQILLSYLQDLKDTNHPPPLSGRLETELVKIEQQWAAYVATVNSAGHWAANGAAPILQQKPGIARTSAESESR